MLSQNMFCHLGVYRRSLIDEIGGFRSAYDGSQDYDLVLRAQSMTTPDRIRHIPHILYHWRAIPGSAALDGDDAKTYALGRARLAIADCLAQSNTTAEVLASPHSAFSRVRYALPEPAPRVTIVIPTRDKIDLLQKCVDGLLYRTSYPDIEILIVDNQSKEPATHAYFNHLSVDPRVSILSYDAPFNFSAINNFAIAQATGPLLCLLNNDVEVINSDWLNEMASHALRPGIGSVGAFLYYPDGRIQHGGVITGAGGVAWHAHHRLPRGDHGYFGRGALVQNLSAVTAACMVMRKAVFDQVGGFDEKNLSVAYNDVDLCLRLREAGYRIVWTPHAELYHRESASRGPDTDPGKVDRFKTERGYMLRRWGRMLDHDPFYNPNLSLDGRFDLAFPPRVEWPWRRMEAGRPASLTSSKEAGLIAASGLFNPAWYLAQNPDVKAAGIDPLEHYLGTGSTEGRCPNPVFDPTWYREQYPDVAATGTEPLIHYLGTGSAEGRRPSPHFDPASYREQHPDVVAAGMEPLVHYLLNTVSGERRSHIAGRLTDFPDMRIPDFFELRGITPRGPIAVVLHLYYPELWDEMRIAVKNISRPFDIFVSLVKGISDHMREVIRQAFPYAYIFDFPENRGRDLVGFLALIQTGVLFRYELVCKLHSKRSPFEPDGDGWRRALINGILGSSEQVDQIASAFRSDADLGMVVADGNIYSEYEHWSGNEKLLAELLPRIGISPVVKGRSFPGGSMFWIRPLLLRTLAGAGLNLSDFDPEPLPRDGTLGHAVERMFGLICEDAECALSSGASSRRRHLARPGARRRCTSLPITSPNFIPSGKTTHGGAPASPNGRM